MTQLYDGSILETSLDKEINVSSVPDSGPPQRDPFYAQLKVANQPEESLAIQMLPNLPPETEPTQVQSTSLSDSELGTDDFDVPANKLAGRQIPFAFKAMHIVNYLSSVMVNLNRLVDLGPPCQGTRKLNSERIPGATQCKIAHCLI